MISKRIGNLVMDKDVELEGDLVIVEEIDKEGT